MRATNANAAKLFALFGATLDHVVQEAIYVTDVEAASTVVEPVCKAAHGKDQLECASTLAGVTRLAFPEQLIEISFTAVLPG